MKLILLVLFIPVVVAAQWGPAVKLSIHAMSAGLNENANQCLAVNGDTLNVVWSDHRTQGYAIYYERSIDAGTTWNTAIPITDTSGHATMPAIAVSGITVHVVWMDSTLGHRASFYKRSLDGGNTWGVVFILDSNTSFWPGIAVNGSMVYATLNKTLSGNSEVFLRRSTDNGMTWEPEIQISNAQGRSEDPAIAVQGTYVHLVWNDNRWGNMQIYYRRSTDSGVTWGPETALINAGAMSYSSMICLNDSNADVPCGDTRAGTYDIWLKQSSDFGTTWGNDMQLTTDLNVEVYPYMVCDGLKLHLVYQQINQGGWYLYSGNGGTTWDSAVYLADGLQFFIQYTGCILHVIWTDNGAVYYMQNPTGNCGSVGIGNNESEKINPVRVYPNPFTSQTTVEINSTGTSENTELKVFDLLGQEILSKSFGNNQRVMLSRDNLNSGVYFYRVFQKEKIIATGKIVVV